MPKLRELAFLLRKVYLVPESTRTYHQDYPKGTVLLETRLRYGELSYKEADLVRRESGWSPPEEILQSLRQKHGSKPEAKVKLIVEGNGILESVEELGRCTVL